jgi:hypothetical protein
MSSLESKIRCLDGGPRPLKHLSVIRRADPPREAVQNGTFREGGKPHQEGEAAGFFDACLVASERYGGEAGEAGAKLESEKYLCMSVGEPPCKAARIISVRPKWMLASRESLASHNYDDIGGINAPDCITFPALAPLLPFSFGSFLFRPGQGQRNPVQWDQPDRRQSGPVRSSQTL